MKTLHQIPKPIPTAYIWVHLYGGNGRTIGKTMHLYEIERKGIAPLVENRPRRPMYIQPWTVEDILTGRWGNATIAKHPICGPLKTRATFINLDTWMDWRGHCEQCQAIARGRGIVPKPIDLLNREDPWNQIPTDQRQTAMDPLWQ